MYQANNRRKGCGAARRFVKGNKGVGAGSWSCLEESGGNEQSRRNDATCLLRRRG